jgi:hypothetical protein
VELESEELFDGESRDGIEGGLALVNFETCDHVLGLLPMAETRQ